MHDRMDGLLGSLMECTRIHTLMYANVPNRMNGCTNKSEAICRSMNPSIELSIYYGIYRTNIPIHVSNRWTWMLT
jgi:hypothetical protein